MECEQQSKVPAQQVTQILPQHSEQFEDWLSMLARQKLAIDQATQCDIIARGVMAAHPTYEQLVRMDDQYNQCRNSPIYPLSDTAKELLRQIAMTRLPESRPLLLVVRSYILQDKLRTINLQQRLLELWKGAWKQEVATIYSWFSRGLYLQSPQVVVQLVSYMINHSSELLRKVELEDSCVADRVLHNHPEFRLQSSEKDRSVFKWLFRQSSPTTKKTVFAHYARLSAGHLPYFIEIIGLAVRSIPEDVLPLVRQHLTDMLVLSTSSQKIEAQVFMVLSQLANCVGDIHERVAHFMTGCYHSRKQQFTSPIMTYISAALDNRLNTLPAEFLRVLLIETRRHLVEDQPSSLPISVEVLLKLMQSQLLTLELCKEICSSVLTVVQFRRCGLVTLYCLAVLQGMVLIDSAATERFLVELNKRGDFLSQLTNEAYSQQFVRSGLSASELEPYRRLFVLAAAKILRWQLSEDQLMPLWYEVVDHCNRMASIPKLCSIDVNQHTQLTKEELEDAPQPKTMDESVHPKRHGLASLSILHQDQFAQIRSVAMTLRERFPIEFPFANYQRVFHTDSSSVRQVVRLKHH